MEGTIRIKADVRGAVLGINRIEKSLGNLRRNAKMSTASLKGIERAASGINTALTAATAAFAGFLAARGASNLVQTAKDMENLRTQLTAYLGSQQLANAEIERLTTLSDNLIQSLPEVSQAFVILKRNGVDVANDSLTAFSKVAAGNDKTMTQLAEAVADALTGQFERLKEFGVKVSQENDKFVIRFADGSSQVVNNAQDVVAAVRAQGEEGGKFADVVAGPLTQAFSNLEGAVFKAKAALVEKSGLSLAIADVSKRIKDWIDANPQLIQQIGQGLTKAFLTAVEAAKLVWANIGLIGKAFLAFFALKAGMAVIGIATALAGPLYKALKLAAAGVLFLSKALIRNPLIALGAGIVLAIGKVTGALDALYDKVLDLGKEAMDGAGDALISTFDDVKELLLDNVEGIDMFNDRMEEINRLSDEYYKKAQETTKALTEQEAAQKRLEAAELQKTLLIKQQKLAYDAFVAGKKEELRISQLTAEEQLGIKLIEEARKAVGTKLEESDKARLRDLAKQTIELQKQQEYLRKIQGLAAQNVQEIFAGSQQGLRAALQEQRAVFVESQKQLMEQLKKTGALRVGEEEYYAREIERIANQIYGVKKDRLYDEVDTQALINEMLITAEIKKQETIEAINKKYAERSFQLWRAKNIRQMEEDAKYYTSLAHGASGNAAQQAGYQEKISEAVNSRIEFEKKSEFEKAQFVVQQGADMYSALGAHNKKAFEAAKAFNIANAIMNTYLAATKALASFPPPFNFVAAAAAIGMGLAQVATIKSQQYSGRALGGPVMGGTPYIVGENGPELFTPATTGSITRNSELQGGAPVNVNFNIQAVDTAGFDDLLVERRGVITQIISDAMLERGQRGL